MHADGQKCRVLVIEDEALVAMLIEEMIHDSGGEMVGPASTVTDALALARDAQADVALLDLNLKGVLAYPVAEVLRGRGMPIVFASGYGADALVRRFQDCPMLDKPFDQPSLEHAIETVLRSRSTSPAPMA